MKKTLKRIGLFPLASYLHFSSARLLTFSKWRAVANAHSIWLELGSGSKKGSNGWTTIDLSGADIVHDLRLGIPFKSNSVDRIYSSHMFEHIPYQELLVFLKECFRVLKKGGELSVCVPNAGFYINAYSEKKYFREYSRGYQPAVVNTGSLIDQINYIAYMGQLHKYMFDEENLVNTLKKVAFSRVELRDFDASIDLESRDFESIYAAAIK